MLRFIILLLFIHHFSYAQNGFADDFTDGDLTNMPSWIGNVSKFEVNASNQLQLNDPSASSPAHLTTNSSIAKNGVWEFFVEMKFAPSASNFCKVYLVSDQEDLASSLNGYFVRIGGQSGTIDDVSLYRQDGSGELKIIDGFDGTVANKPKLKVKVKRTNSTDWELHIDTSSSFNNFILQGTAIDNTYSLSNYFGVYCKYTSSRADKFFFDDFRVDSVEFQDTTQPKLLNIDVVNEQSINVFFDEPVDSISASDTTNFFVTKGIGEPSSILLDTSNKLKVGLNFSNTFQSGTTYQLIVSNVEDHNGNSVRPDSLSFLYFKPINAQKRDVVINEVYPDFSPSNGLPDGEFIELFNASNTVFDLKDWLISDGNSTAVLSSQLLHPGEYIILSSVGVDSAYAKIGLIQGLSNFPSLNNSGDYIQLFDNNSELIDEIDYTTDWYNDELKREGGYSIEQKNPYTFCTGKSNFSASNAILGGTPGKENSVFDTIADVVPPHLIDISIIAADSFLLHFNELLDTSSSSSASYIFTPSASVSQIVNQAPNYQDILLVLETPLDSGIATKLTINNLKDCWGNKIDSSHSTSIILPQTPIFNDIVINEILFNPRTGGSDFVELYNRSKKVLSLKNWKMANFDDTAIANQKDITSQAILFFPGEYIAFTEDLNNIRNEYPSTVVERFIEIDDLPSYNDKEGTVYVLDNEGTILDQVTYSENQHFELLNDKKGVSLERISADRPSNDRTNFHSAAESVGFATPAYENSQFFPNLAFKGRLTIEPKTFSPDNDGYRDIVNINYQFEAPGFVANVTIYDKSGRQIKSLVKNQLLGKKGSFSWNGITDVNTKARIGIYVIYFEAFHPNGNVEKFKEAIVVAGNLN